jgi:hypothetical protein
MSYAKRSVSHILGSPSKNEWMTTGIISASLRFLGLAQEKEK